MYHEPRAQSLVYIIASDVEDPYEDQAARACVIEALVEVDEMLAKIIYEEAEVYAGVPKVDRELEKCVEEFEKAQKELEHTKKDGALDPKYSKPLIITKRLGNKLRKH